MPTLRQLAANRRNAQKSTGPKTESGKEQSSRNALVHGLAGAGVVLPADEASEIEGRKKVWRYDFRPNKGQQEWWFMQMVIHSIRVERCQTHERAIREDLARRAASSWETDRTLEVETLAGRLARKPALAASRLRTTRHGCLWLIGQWLALGAVLDESGAWDEEHRSLAYELQSVSPLFRHGDPWPTDGGPQTLVEEGVRGLETLLAEALDLQDEENRKAAEVGVELEVPRALALLRRYEAACTRQMEFARARLAELQEVNPPREDMEIFPTAADLVPTAPTAPASPLRVELLDKSRDDPKDDDFFGSLGFERLTAPAKPGKRRAEVGVS